MTRLPSKQVRDQHHGTDIDMSDKHRNTEDQKCTGPMTDCPNCNTEMESHGISGDYRTSRGIQGIDISWDRCPECQTIIDDRGNVRNKHDN